MVLCTILCANILAAQTFTVGGLNYKVIDNNSVQVARQSSSAISGSVVIPSTVTYGGTTYSVTSIGGGAFSNCRGLTSVTIPNSVTSIGDYAFDGCSSLTTLNFNAINCQDFELDISPYYITSLFSGIPLTTVNIGDSVQRIPANFVLGCSGLTSVTIPNSVTSIGGWAFYGCSGLTSVTIPTGVTSIGDEAFSGCSGLTTLNFNAINCQVFDYAFGTSLTTVNIGDSVQRIPAFFVDGCSGLTSVTIGTGVTSIGNSAFLGCSGLTSVTIGNSVTSIGGSAFSGCSGLTTLNFNAIDCQDFNYCPFSGTSLTTVNIGDSVQRIPAYFVRGCSGLTSVTIPNSVTSIGVGAFSGCSGLTSVTIPNSVTSIGDTAFKNCSGLTSVTIGNGVTSIGGWAFYGCSGLTTLNFNAINCQDFESSYFNGNYYGFGNSLTTVNIGDSVQRIPANFVSGCSGLTSVTIPNSVTSIGGYAFKNCSGLTSVTIPNSVTSIGGGTFYGCSGLVSVVIGDGITNIGSSLFENCPNLTYLTIGRSVESIENGAFLNCSLLSQITSLATVPPEIGGIEAFPYPNFCTVTVPCGSLAAYTTPTCRWNIFFPQRITESSSFELSVSANDEAYGRVEVENHSCESKTLTAIANDGYEFTGWNDGNTENPRTVTLTNDTAFTAIFTETETTPTITVTVNDATMGSASYTLDGNTAILTATANEGYEFTAWNDGNTENPRTVTVTSDTAFVAIFTETETTPTITVTVNDATMGSASYTMDGNIAVLTATPNEGYEFTGWNDGNTENPRTVTITSDTAFMAIFTASGSSSLQEVNAREFALYPNPAKSFVTLEFETLQENTLLQILDINGRRVRTVELKAGIETLQIDVSDLPKGVYTIMLGNTTKKLIVE